MEGGIGLHHVRRDPRSPLRILRARPSAMLHDRITTSVERHREMARPKAPLQAARDMEMFWEEDGAGIVRPPEDRLTFVVPGKDAVPVCCEQPFRPETAAGCKEPAGRSMLAG